MVLDNSSSPSEVDAFNSENAPADDSDAYSDSNQKAGAFSYRIDMSKVAKPMPIFGYRQDKFQLLLRAKLQNAQNVLARSPTQEEAEAMAFWTAKQLQIISFGLPLGTAGGVWRAYNSRATFRFPFWQPNLENYRSADGTFRFIGLRGNRATTLLHVFRTVAYGGIGQFIGEILFGSYAASVGAVGELGDKRLKSYMAAIRRKAHEKRGAISTPTVPQSTKGPNSSAGGDSDQSMNEQDSRELAEGYYNEGNSDATSSTPQSPQSQPSTRRPPVTFGRSSDYESQEDKASSSYEYDEASPTGGEGIRDDAARGGSAWDRIRSGANVGNKSISTQQQPIQRESAWSKRQAEAKSTPEDSFSYSKPDEERGNAQQEAQREFDAKVERERKGGSFSNNGDGSKRW